MLLAGSTAEPTIRYTRRSVWLRVTLYPWTRVLTSDSSLHSRDCCTDERCAQEQCVSDCCRRTRHGGGTCRSAPLAHKNQIREPTLRPAAPYCLAPSRLGVHRRAPPLRHTGWGTHTDHHGPVQLNTGVQEQGVASETTSNWRRARGTLYCHPPAPLDPPVATGSSLVLAKSVLGIILASNHLRG